jgi:hypothetical protein
LRAKAYARRVSFCIGIGGFIAGMLFHASTAFAGSMDPTPERYVLQPPNLPAGATCQSIAMNPSTGLVGGNLPNNFPCSPDNVAFRNMISELGFAIAPTAFHPARTTGIGGFALTLEANYTHINSSSLSTATDGTKVKYWQTGTQGSADPNTKAFPTSNSSPDSMLQIYAMKARKGLPFGFEVTGSLGFIANTTMWVGGADVRWSLLEGFRTGPLGIFPDVSVGGGVRTVTGTSKFNLTTVGIDAQVSKPIALGDSATITPVIGYQRLIILGDSNIIDLTPNVDPLQQCGYAGPDAQTGAPTCRNKLSNGADNNGDFNNNVTFDKVRVQRNRGILGVNYKYEILYLATQIAFDLTSPHDWDPTLTDARQWTLSFEGGVFF